MYILNWILLESIYNTSIFSHQSIIIIYQCLLWRLDWWKSERVFAPFLFFERLRHLHHIIWCSVVLRVLAARLEGYELLPLLIHSCFHCNVFLLISRKTSIKLVHSSYCISTMIVGVVVDIRAAHLLHWSHLVGGLRRKRDLLLYTLFSWWYFRHY